LSGAFFNYRTFWPDDWWARRSFLAAWWRLYRGDPHAVPPDFPALARHLHAIGRAGREGGTTQPLYLEALPRRGSSPSNPQAPIVSAAYFEEAVAAAIVQLDPRPASDTAYLSLMRCANDEETLERLLGAAMEYAAQYARTRLVGPCGIIPTWQSGALLDYFHLPPPLHTPYNPPYLPELLATTMEPWRESALYVAEPVLTPVAYAGPASVVPLAPARLAADLLPLLAASLETDDQLPIPDNADAGSLLHWLQAYPLSGWLAEIDGAPAGFVLVQPDLAPLMRRAEGGRLWPWRAYAAWRKHAPARAGRLLLGAVAPPWRGQGIGRQLWQQVQQHALAAGWRELSCGPFPPDGPAAAFLTGQGARPRQRYMLYSWSAW
jgi:GNAT superfamily N-acetyltransferase